MYRYLVIYLFTLLSVSMAAQEAAMLRPCRMGKRSALHRASAHAPMPLLNRSEAASRYQGDRQQLVALVSFTDKQFQEANPLTLWDQIFNQPGYRKAPFEGSVRDYFYAQSYGRFQLQFDLHYVALSANSSKYRSTDYDDDNSLLLVKDILSELQQRDIDWSPYDWDGDGYVDQLLIVYAGKGQNDGGGSQTIWPHQWWVSEHPGGEPLQVSGGGDTLLVDAYCCVQEMTGSGTYGTFGTICHEYSHCFGLPDFYYGSSKSYVRQWDLMDYGNHNGNGFCPPGYSAHERMFMGWMTIPELTEAVSVDEMEALADSAQAYLIRNDNYPSEFYVVENRQQRGWDRSLPGSGILVFHIDFDDDIWRGLTSEYVNQPAHQRYTIFPANNSTSSLRQSGWAYPYADNDSLTSLSEPAATLLHANSSQTKLMEKPLYNISIDAGGRASFCFMKPRATSVRQPLADGRPGRSDASLSGVCYNLRGERVAFPSRGIYLLNGRKVLVR